MIDQMFRGASRGPDAGQAVRSLLPNDTPSQLSVVSNLQICTSPASLRAILSRAKGVAVMFTSATCPPCRTIKPVFEDLARTHGSATAKQRIEFALVDIAVGAGAEIARGTEFGRPVHATPTFVFFAQGRVYSHCKGANPRELEMQVAGLVGEVYPGELQRAGRDRCSRADDTVCRSTSAYKIIRSATGEAHAQLGASHISYLSRFDRVVSQTRVDSRAKLVGARTRRNIDKECCQVPGHIARFASVL